MRCEHDYHERNRYDCPPRTGDCHSGHSRRYDSDIEIHSPCGISVTDKTKDNGRIKSLLVDKSIAADVREKLLKSELLNLEYKPQEFERKIALPITSEAALINLDWFSEDTHSIASLPLSQNIGKGTPAQAIAAEIAQLFDDEAVAITDDMKELIPTKWDLFGDLAVIPKESLNSPEWNAVMKSKSGFEARVWEIICRNIKVNRLARQAEIATDNLRSSQVTMIYGDSGEVEFIDHGVKFYLDVTKVMFSSGNVTERHRIGDIDMTGECIVDAFAGIGYYTLPMLVRSNAKQVYACELNPNSIQALTRGAELNNVTDRLTILHGDNQETLPKLRNVADRVHLGILPSSEPTWRLAVDCLKNSGGILHLHMNLNDSEIDSFTKYCIDVISDYALQHCDFSNVSLLHVEKVKWYAPHIRHVVLDLRIE